MGFKVELKPSGHEFTVKEGETILDAAVRHGISLPYGCREGTCGSCKGKLLSGQIDYAGAKPLALSACDGATDEVLLCFAHPLTDLVLEADESLAAKGIIIKTLPCKVAKMVKLTPDVMQLSLQLPKGESFKFLAGQYLDILIRDGRRRGFSIANAPNDTNILELQIRHIEGGEFTTHVFTSMKEQDLLRFEGPLGSFYLREDSDRPIIFMAGGTGFAPIKSIIEDAFTRDITRPVHLYWGVRDRTSLYLPDMPLAWQEQYSNFNYTPILSEPAENDQWTGRTGLVHEAVIHDYPDLSTYDVYACGSPVMVDAGRDAFHENGLPNGHYYSDAFVFSGS